MSSLSLPCPHTRLKGALGENLICFHAHVIDMGGQLVVPPVASPLGGLCPPLNTGPQGVQAGL